MPKVIPYEEMGYDRKKAIYDAIAQSFQDLKIEKAGGVTWNNVSEKLEGVTMRLMGEDGLLLTYHRSKQGTLLEIQKTSDDGKELLGELEKELKKRFKKITGKTLKLKEKKYDQSVEKTSQIQNRDGQRQYGRYLVRDSRVYEFDCEALDD